jgi:hypothetical protein
MLRVTMLEQDGDELGVLLSPEEWRRLRGLISPDEKIEEERTPLDSIARMTADELERSLESFRDPETGEIRVRSGPRNGLTFFAALLLFKKRTEEFNEAVRAEVRALRDHPSSREIEPFLDAALEDSEDWQR